MSKSLDLYICVSGRICSHDVSLATGSPQKELVAQGGASDRALGVCVGFVVELRRALMVIQTRALQYRKGIGVSSLYRCFQAELGHFLAHPLGCVFRPHSVLAAVFWG